MLHKTRLHVYNKLLNLPVTSFREFEHNSGKTVRARREVSIAGSRNGVTHGHIQWANFTFLPRGISAYAFEVQIVWQLLLVSMISLSSVDWLSQITPQWVASLLSVQETLSVEWISVN